MKRLISILLLSIAAAFVACGDDDNTLNGSDWLLTPQPVVTGTSVTVTCKTNFAGNVLTSSRCGFVYALVENDTTGEFLEAREVSVTGQTLTCRLSGLNPETAYVVYAYVETGSGRMTSNRTNFTTGEGEDPIPSDDPVFATPTSSNVTFSAATISASFSYQGNAPISEVYFLYGTDEGTPAREAVTASAGEKTALLTGLTPSTTYMFQLCVEIGDKVYRSITAEFTTGSDPELMVPTFGSPSHSNVDASSATVNCSFAYAGSETVSEVYFQYSSTVGTLRVAVPNTNPGIKSATLSNLTPSTSYSYRLYVVIGDKTYSSTAGTFTTDAEVVGETLFSGWAELPTTKEKTGDWYYTYHITDVNTPAGHKARNYSVCYSKELMCAVWVAAPMHSFYSVKNTSRTDAYKTDPNFNFTQVGRWDGYTRGHLLGSSERLVSRYSNEQVFYWSNIAPQLGQPYFNTGGGAWNTLEDWVDTQWENKADTTYQVIGSYWANKNKVVAGTTVPTHYYKVLLRTKNRSAKWVQQCTREELQCIAIMIEHRTYSKDEVPKPNQYQSKGLLMSVAELENMTGLTFFGNVPNAPKDSYTASDWGL